MTDTTAQEPTMEEILASIRRIISEDEAPAAAPAPAAPEPAPAPVATSQPEPEPEPEPESPPAAEATEDEEEILELTDRYEAPPAESIGDLDVSGPQDEPEPFPAAAEPAGTAPMVTTEPEEPLVGETAAASAASAFAGLAASFRTPDPVPTGGTGPTIDDLARALLRPMLKEWLDEHLQGIVEAAVKKEVERIARLA
ncbi:MAG: DUF2497 domain-containing protein [Caulobacteraceae bacterium]|nr:DUF2497 domain-containing protein [Caulobacteraceae bacterium]